MMIGVILSATFEKDENSGLLIVRCDPPVNGCCNFVFSSETIASWKALLGLASTREAIAAIMQGREDRSRYDPTTVGACGLGLMRPWKARSTTPPPT